MCYYGMDSDTYRHGHRDRRGWGGGARSPIRNSAIQPKIHSASHALLRGKKSGSSSSNLVIIAENGKAGAASPRTSQGAVNFDGGRSTILFTSTEKFARFPQGYIHFFFNRSRSLRDILRR